MLAVAALGGLMAVLAVQRQANADLAAKNAQLADLLRPYLERSVRYRTLRTDVRDACTQHRQFAPRELQPGDFVQSEEAVVAWFLVPARGRCQGDGRECVPERFVGEPVCCDMNIPLAR